MKTPLLLTICVLMCAGLVFSSTGCRKFRNEGGAITIKGRFLQDCSGIPVKDKLLEFYLNSHSTLIGGHSGIIGHATTDLEGNFSVTGTNYGSGGLRVSAESNGKRYVSDYTISGGDGAVVDLGTLYEEFYYSRTIKFEKTGSKPTDTLYMGLFSNFPSLLAVGSDIDGFTFQSAGKASGMTYAEPEKMVWGIGIADYRRAADSMDAYNPASYHLINVRLGICVDDTVFVKL